MKTLTKLIIIIVIIWAIVLPMRLTIKMLTAVIAVSLFAVCYIDYKNLTSRQQTQLLFTGLLFLMWSAII